MGDQAMEIDALKKSRQGMKFVFLNDTVRNVEVEMKGLRSLIEITYDRESTKLS